MAVSWQAIATMTGATLRALAFALLLVPLASWPAAPTSKLTIAVNDRYIGSALVLVAAGNGYFKDAGLEVDLQRYVSGSEALKAALAGKADFATTGEVPVMYAVMAGQPVSIVATLSLASRDQGIVARKDRGIASVADLRGKRVGTIPGTSGHYVLETLLISNRIRPSEVQLVSLKADQLLDALANGQVDAISAWEPMISNAAASLGDGAVVFLAANQLYQATWNLVGTPQAVARNAEPVKRLLKALLRAERYIAERPSDAKEIYARATSTGLAEIQRLWPKYNVALRLEQGLITLLESQARWAMRLPRSEQRSMPNFLDTLYPDAVLAVKPTAMSVIR